MSVTLGPTLATLSGTPVLLYPVPTPWPISAGCDKYIYRQSNEGLILAFDPMYPSIVGQKAASCFRTEVSSWWLQPDSANPSTALGPTFVCPQSYSAVHSTVLESNSAAQTHYTYCCPPNFRMGAIYPPNTRSVVQCTSTVAPGSPVSFESFTFVNNVLTIIPTSTVVTGASAATVYAPPVNGYNIVQQAVSGSSSGSGTSGSSTGSASTTGTTGSNAPTPPPGGGSGGNNDATETAQPSGPSTGTIAGAVVGGVLGFVLLAAIAFLLWRRGRRPSHDSTPELAAGGVTGTGADGTKGYYAGSGSPQDYSAASEMPVKYFPPAHELPQEDHRHELAYQEHQRFELPTGQDNSYPSPNAEGR